MVPSVPTYDYQCRQCGRTTEVIHSMLEDGPSTCEHCGGPLRRFVEGVAARRPRRSQADRAWRVPQRRQNRALADSERPQPTQFWTATALRADATSRADASHNAVEPPSVRCISSEGLTPAPLDR